ncbi:MAG: transposase [Candidatus Ozemobacteraceae bacterium]
MIRIPQLRCLVQQLFSVFTCPSQILFMNLIEGWILCPCRRFITSIYQFGDPQRERSHDAYHRFVRIGAWSLHAFLQALAKMVIELFGHPNTLWVLGDDTVHKKTGHKVEGAKSCRDAVRSTKKRMVFAWGLQIVLLCLLVRPPWGGEPLALPINMRLYRKRPDKKTGKSILDLMHEMLLDVMDWFPGRMVYFVGDGFYASLAGRIPPGMHLISRIRYDAAIFKMPPKHGLGRRGRPRQKGEKLPTPKEIAATAKDWKIVKTNERGEEGERLVVIRHVVWHRVMPGKRIRLVISRGPKGGEEDDFFFTTDLTLDPTLLISLYFDRWSIEDTFRNGKQFLGIEQPQSWKGPGPERVAALGYAVYSLVWSWFIKNGDFQRFPDRPWYKTKATPSFQDALAGIRHQIWVSRFNATVPDSPDRHKFSEIMIEALSRAA